MKDTITTLDLPRGFATTIRARGQEKGFQWSPGYIYQVRCGYRNSPALTQELLRLAEEFKAEQKAQEARLSALISPTP